MQTRPHQLPLTLCLRCPGRVSPCPHDRPAGAGRNRVADRPQDIRVRLIAAVRPVQHHQSPAFHEGSLSEPTVHVSFERRAILNELHHD